MIRFVLLSVLLWLGFAEAQVVRSFTSRYNTNTNGNISLIGNTLMTCSPSGINGSQCANARSGTTTGGLANNNNFTMVYVDADTDPSTFNSSSAQLTLPPGATVLWAGLYWMASAPSGGVPSPNTVRFRTPVSAYTTLTATQTDSANTGSGLLYQGFVEVTSLVQAGGSGAYWAANVAGQPNASNMGAGWSLVVVYQQPSEPLRHLNVFDGFANVSGTTTVTTTVSGFLTPATGPVTAYLGSVALEGDRGTTGDRLRLNGTDISNAQNPANNYFNSTITDLGAHVTSKTPNYINQLGFDLDRSDVSGVLPNGATSATVQFVSSGDAYAPGVLTFAVNIFAPNLSATFSKSASDLNGGQVLPGDILEYTLSFTNTGGDGATNVVLRDPIPAHTAYVPGSLQVITNAPTAPTGSFTDASGDDIAEYSASCPELSGAPCVRFRLGAGANASNGGLILPTQGASVRFRVQVQPSAAGQTLTNTASVSYNSQTLGTSFNQTASASASASVPTPPSLSKGFAPSAIPPNGASTLTLTLSNPNPTPATLTANLVDSLPAGLVVASPASASTTCPGGSVSATPGGTSITLSSGAQIPAGGSCTVTVQVTGSTPGSYTNTLPAGALETNLGNNPSPASATLTITGASVSGRIYHDLEPDGSRQPSEDWAGAPSVRVNLVQGGTVVQSLLVGPGSGDYSFSGVAPGSYTIVVTDTAISTTPTPPSGWIFVSTGARSVSVASSNLTGQDFGLFNGSRIRGTVFRDDGLSGAAANDALQNGGEVGIPDVVVTASSGANSRSATTDAFGFYTLFIPASFGATVTLSHPQQPATGSNVGGASVSLATGYNSAAAASRTISGFTPGQYYEGYNFGVVRPSLWQPDQSGQASSPGVVTYAHRVRPGTLGTLTFLRLAGGWNYLLRLDANCDGDFADAGEGYQGLPYSLTVGSAWPREADGSLRACAVEVMVIVPAGLPGGSSDLLNLASRLRYAGNAAVDDLLTLTDTTIVGVGGELRLTKQVQNLTQGTPPSTGRADGKPGEVLEYCIAYQNQSSAPITQVLLTDPIPFFTDYQPGTLRLDATPLTDVADADAGEVSGGLVRVRIGTLAAGAGGQVCYRVRIR